MVNSIAADIYESLKQNGDIKQVLSSVFNREKRQSVLQNLADSLMIKSMGVKSRGRDSGLYSGAEENSNENCHYSSTCSVENKQFKNEVESYEEFVANLPLPVAEFNKETVRA